MLDINFNFKSEDIPVTFEHEGKTYKGLLSWVPGAGGYTWHLSVNRYHWGQYTMSTIISGRSIIIKTI